MSNKSSGGTKKTLHIARKPLAGGVQHPADGGRLIAPPPPPAAPKPPKGTIVIQDGDNGAGGTVHQEMMARVQVISRARAEMQMWNVLAVTCESDLWHRLAEMYGVKQGEWQFDAQRLWLIPLPKPPAPAAASETDAIEQAAPPAHESEAHAIESEAADEAVADADSDDESTDTIA